MRPGHLSRALHGSLREAGITEGPVFREVRRGGRLAPPCPAHGVAGDAGGTVVGLSGKAVGLVVKRACQRVGLEPARFGAPLLAGMATAAHAAGKSPITIARQGRWASLAIVSRYIRPELFDANAMEDVGL